MEARRSARLSPPRRRRPHVTVRGLTKRFGKASIYEQFDLDIPRGKLISVFGPNGCGKSTLINMIAGLIPPDAGEILFDGKPLRAIKFGYVFQNYREALFPWLRSVDNIEYPLKLMKLPKAERRARVEKLVAHLGVKIDLKRYPYEMSGGQQQLVSIMRALVVEPEILFLDEPFSALDYEMTLFMREQLQRIFMETGTTTVLVSHDLEEAVYLADHVLLLSRRPAQIADYRALRCAAAAHRRDAVGAGIRRHQGALPRSVPARGAQADETRARSISAGARRGRPDRALVSRGLGQIVDPVLLPSPTDTFRAHVEGHGRRPARLSISCMTVERTVARHADRGRDRHSARHLSRRHRSGFIARSSSSSISSARRRRRRCFRCSW